MARCFGGCVGTDLIELVLLFLPILTTLFVLRKNLFK